MKSIYENRQLESVLNDFYNATGILMAFVRDDNIYVKSKGALNEYCKLIQSTPEGCRRCQKCDFTLLEKCSDNHQLNINTCHAGLTDAAAPIIINEKIVGYLILGQMKNTENFEAVAEKVNDLEIEESFLKDSYERLPLYKAETIQSIAKIAVILTEYIAFRNMIIPKNDKIIESAMHYISNNLDKPLTVNSICKNIGVSKSTLYNSFKKHFNCTVSDYINSKRLKKAKELLISTNLSVEKISQAVGFESFGYFCKLFKNANGITALKYKKMVLSNEQKTIQII